MNSFLDCALKGTFQQALFVRNLKIDFFGLLESFPIAANFGWIRSSVNALQILIKVANSFEKINFKWEKIGNFWVKIAISQRNVRTKIHSLWTCIEISSYSAENKILVGKIIKYDFCRYLERIFKVFGEE